MRYSMKNTELNSMMQHAILILKYYTFKKVLTYFHANKFHDCGDKLLILEHMRTFSLVCQSYSFQHIATMKIPEK